MQAYTHIVTGVALGRLAQRFIPERRVALAAGVLAAALSHPFMDTLAQLTYHPSEPRFHDPAWVAYHAVAYSLGAAFFFLFRREWPFAVASVWTDLDWILRALHVPWPEGFLHHMMISLPGIRTFAWAVTAHLPNLRGDWPAAFPELFLFSFAGWALLRRTQADRTPSPDSSS